MNTRNEMTKTNPSPTLLLIDLECTCNDVPPLPKGESEIIEIGMVFGVLEQTGFIIVDELQLYVQPTVHPVLTRFCIELTGIQQATLNHALQLNIVISQLAGFLEKHDPSAWGSWGKFDARQFEQETASKYLPNPLESIPHLNIKQLFARKRGHRVGLGRAIQLSGLSFIGNQHSGLDDARNIGQLIDNDHLLRNTVLDRL